MEQLPEVPKIRQMYEVCKELTKSPTPVVSDCAVLVLGILHDLLNNVDPYYLLETEKEQYARIIDYE